MKIGIMQPYFFAYLGYWQLINAVDRYVVYDDVAWINRGWINRNNILLNGQSQMITLPVSGASQNKLINEVLIAKDDRIVGKLLNTIRTAYARAPYFAAIMPMIERLVVGSNGIAQLNYSAVLAVCGYLSIDTEVILSSDIEKDNFLKGQKKILSICKLLGGDTYINAIGGESLYNGDDFRMQGIRLCFLKMDKVLYKQYGCSFVENLSIIDVLMFNSPREVKKLLGEYELLYR